MSGERKSNRRDFIKGKSLAREFEERLESTGDAGSNETSSEDVSLRRQANYLQQFTKTAMACEFELLFNMGQFENAGDVSLQTFELVDRLEAQMTVYRDDSELSKINRRAGIRPRQVESQLLDLLQAALEIHKQTDGAFDITAGPLSKIWGFEQRSGRVPSQNRIDAVLRNVGSELIEIDPTLSTISLANPATTLNLGGIGKGYAVDRAAQIILDGGITDFVIHGGQSSVKGFGRQSTTTPKDSQKNNGWIVGLSHPSIPEKRLGEFCLRNQALGTSGTGRQGFYHNGVRYGHIIDPRTGWPTQHVLSSTVITEKASRADALATAFFVMKLSEVQRFCDENKDVKTILVLPGEKSGRIQIETFNMDDGDWNQL